MEHKDAAYCSVTAYSKQFHIVMHEWNMTYRSTYMFGSSMASAPFLRKTPSTKMPFFPRHLMKNFGRSTPAASAQMISRWTLDTNVDCPIFTSTSSRLLLRPIVTRVLRIVYSKLWPLRYASCSVPYKSVSRTTLLSPDANASMFFIVCLQIGADCSARRAKASLSDTLVTCDMICWLRK